MWYKYIQNNLILYGQNPKVKYSDKTLNDIDLININPDKYYFSMMYFVERLPPEFEILPAGIYTGIAIDSEFYLTPWESQNQNYTLPFLYLQHLLTDINKFIEFRDNENFKRLGILHKQGILLYGPPGTGKTTAIHSLLNNLQTKIDTNKVIVIYLSGTDFYFSFIKAFQKDTRLKIIIIEELTEICNNYSANQKMLDFLDGETSLNNMLVIATTNFPEKLPSNIVNRQGRFDKFYKLGYINKNDAIQYSEYILGRKLTKQEKQLITTVDELSIANLKEILLTTLRNDTDIPVAIETMKKQKQLVQEDFNERKKIGFKGD